MSLLSLFCVVVERTKPMDLYEDPFIFAGVFFIRNTMYNIYQICIARSRLDMASPVCCDLFGNIGF